MKEPLLIALLYMCIVANLIIALFAYSRQDRKRSMCIAVLSCFILIYSLGYLVEIRSSTREGIMTALWVENFSIPMFGPIFTYTTAVFFEPKRIKKWFIPVAFVYGMAMFSVVLFNEYHGLYYSVVAVTQDGFLDLTYGPLFFVQQAVTIVCMIVAYSILFMRFVKGTSRLRKQMGLYVTGATICVSANFINIAGILPEGVDPAPIAFTVGLGFFALDLLSHRLMDIQSMAFNRAVESMDDSVVVLDSDGGFVYANKNAGKLFPTLMTFSGLERISTAKEWPKELLNIVEPAEVDFLVEGSNDIPLVYRANISLVKSEKNKILGWSVVMRDISDMIQTMKKMKELAITDPLTGICNRRQFLDMAETELSISMPNGSSNLLLLFDIDNFKNINDTYGHMAGDYVLCTVVNRLRGQMRSQDLFARIGGEEFAIFSSNWEGMDLFMFADRLRKEIECTDLLYEDKILHVTASFGVGSIPPGCNFSTAMRIVDSAMYKAKTDGRNRVVVGEIYEEAQNKCK